MKLISCVAILASVVFASHVNADAKPKYNWNIQTWHPTPLGMDITNYVPPDVDAYSIVLPPNVAQRWDCALIALTPDFSFREVVCLHKDTGGATFEGVSERLDCKDHSETWVLKVLASIPNPTKPSVESVELHISCRPASDRR